MKHCEVIRNLGDGLAISDVAEVFESPPALFACPRRQRAPRAYGGADRRGCRAARGNSWVRFASKVLRTFHLASDSRLSKSTGSSVELEHLLDFVSDQRRRIIRNRFGPYRGRLVRKELTKQRKRWRI